MLQGKKQKRRGGIFWSYILITFSICFIYQWWAGGYSVEPQVNSDTLNSLPVTVAKPITSAVTYTNNVEGDLRSQPPKSDHEYQIFAQKSSKRPGPTGATMTLHLGVERLSKLLVSGNAWSGHISAGVYIPHTKGDPAVSDLLDGVAKFHQSVEQAGKFHLDIGIVYGLQPDLGQTAAELYRKQYPVNTLRNVALAQVETDLVVIWNYDIQASPAMVEAAMEKEDDAWKDGLNQIRSGKTTVGVIPVFELAYAASMPKDIKDILQLYRGRKIVRYYGDRENVHCGTDYGRWLNSEEPYFVPYHKTYEPFMIAKTEELPWFPDHLKGYLGDREMYLWYIAAMQWKFLVLPKHFGVHPWHADTASYFILLQNRQLFEYAVQANRDFKKMTGAMEGSIDPLELFKSLRPLYAAMPEVSLPYSRDNNEFKAMYKDELDCNAM